MKLWLFLLAICLSAPLAEAQEKTVQKNQVWIGYMTSTKISDKYSIWNDVHYVPESFAIVRTGLTRNVLNNGGITVGYAFLKLPVSPETKLERNEHRPWAQVQLTAPLAAKWSVTQRIRYDARFRQRINDGELADGYTFNHRLRLLLSIRKNIGNCSARGVQPYLAVSNETLLNFGKEITYNTFDQNRASLSFGIQKKQIQYQLGFMNRFVQTGPARYSSNQTVVIWVIQKFDLTRLLAGHKQVEIISE